RGVTMEGRRSDGTGNGDSIRTQSLSPARLGSAFAAKPDACAADRRPGRRARERERQRGAKLVWVPRLKEAREECDSERVVERQECAQQVKLVPGPVLFEVGARVLERPERVVEVDIPADGEPREHV